MRLVRLEDGGTLPRVRARRPACAGVSLLVPGLLCVAVLVLPICGHAEADVPPAASAENEAAGAPASGPSRSQAHTLEAFVRHWFALLAAPGAGPEAFEPHLPEGPFELVLFDHVLRHRRELGSWLDGLREGLSEDRFDVDAVRIVSATPDVQQIRVDVTRRTLGADGLPHLDGRALRWEVRTTAGSAPVIVGAQEERRLPHPGTGTRVVCF